MNRRALHVSADPSVTLPVDWVTLSTVVYGARGAGKTTFGRVVAEEVYQAGLRFSAVDLKGDWWGLRSSASGTDEGLPVVIFGGDHADLPLEAEAGHEVAEMVAELHQPTILDLEQLSKTKQLRFLGAYFERLYDVNREPLLLLLDEAQRYAPQRPMSPEATTCLGAVEDLVKLGRKHGIGPVLFTQRGSGLNKEVSELCDLLVAFRTPGPLDQDRIKDWLDANATREERDSVMAMLARLDTGTAVLASGHPGLRLFQVAKIRGPRTFDSSATPQIGARARTARRMAAVDLAALREKMAAAIERSEANDPGKLRIKVAKLERTAADAAATASAATQQRDEADSRVMELTEALRTAQRQPERVEVSILTHKDRELLTEVWQAATRIAGDLEETAATFSKAAERIAEQLRTPIPESMQPAVENARTSVVDRPPVPATRPVKPPADREAFWLNGELSKGERTILAALASHHGELTRAKMQLITGYKMKAGYMVNTIGRMRSRGLLEPFQAGSDTIRATPEGLALVADVEPLPRPGTELVRYWLARLPSAQKRMLEAFVEAYPDELTKDELGSRTGTTPGAGYFVNSLGRIRGLGLVEGWRASPNLMGV